MRDPMRISVIGLQDSGKTTLAEQMVRLWSQQGLRVAAIKHDGHADVGRGRAGDDGARWGGAGQYGARSGDDWEKPDSDTRRFADAGADYTMVTGGGQTLLRTVRDWEAADIHALCRRLAAFAEQRGEALDVIVIEGYKWSNLPKVAVARNADHLHWLRSERFANLSAVVCSSALRTLAEPEWALYHETDIVRLCADLWLKWSEHDRR